MEVLRSHQGCNPTRLRPRQDNRDIEILGVENNQIPQIVELLEEYSHIDMIPKFEANRWARAF
jgi:hypothetical protein